MSTKRDELIDWLRDAYAMERGLEITLKKQAESDKMLPTLKDKARQHLEETRHHAEIVQGCLQSLGADVSTLKTGMAQMLELGKGMGTMFASDERIKDLLAAYGSEHFEIACYKALRAAGEAANEPQVVAACDRIIPDEEKMAQWLDLNLPAAVREYLATTASA